MKKEVQWMNHRHESATEREPICRLGVWIGRADARQEQACRPRQMAICRHAAMRGPRMQGRGYACLYSEHPCGSQGRRTFRSHQCRGAEP